ncbi:MATE family Na+-driven efflux transporter [Moritella sp. Urea-trap-13]|uniref:MATE family Na+-driven efflux transporter n=1 Tax=Moritella sp. Urea-trap-13 TaxID=2058327 RepID=UPI000C333B0C|nr:MATE family Na+-driven efflux transporter [Moritella sp. Urea-trap-13]PKH06351.1 multidrug transporter [Moritella sp. Urea-trap-13]
MFLNRNKTINYKLLLVLILTSLIPLVYSTTRIHFLGSLPDAWAFSIASQVAWLNVSYEVLREALLLPLMYILGQSIAEDNSYQKRVSTSLSVFVLSYLVMTLIVVFFTPALVKAMQQQDVIFEQTVNYIRLESIAIFVSSLFAFFNLVLVLKNNQKALCGLLFIQTVLIIICDTVFVSQLSFSLQLGVNGIAMTNICVNLVLGIVSYGYLKKSGVSVHSVTFLNQSWLKEWLKIGSKSGLESLVRNTAFIVMVLQLINQVQQSGPFWVTNNFIWGWLLLPVLALGQLIKQDAATNNGMTEQRVNHYLILTGGIVVIWLVTIPAWESFIRNIMGVGNSEEIMRIALLMIGFYVIFALNNVIDSYFYGIGRTDLMLYQSLLVNSLFYGGAFIAYQVGWFEPTLDRIAVMFGLGMTIDAIITFFLYFWLRKQSNKVYAVA